MRKKIYDSLIEGCTEDQIRLFMRLYVMENHNNSKNLIYSISKRKLPRIKLLIENTAYKNREEAFKSFQRIK